MTQFRKSKTFGGLRFTVGKRGVSTSFGSGPLRVSLGSDGKVRRTVRVPGTGVYDTKVVGQRQPTETIQPEQDATPRKRHPWLLAFLVASFAFLLIMILI